MKSLFIRIHFKLRSLLNTVCSIFILYKVYKKKWKRLAGHAVGKLTYHEGEEVCDRGDCDGTAGLLHGQPHPFVETLLLRISMYSARGRGRL